MSRDSKPKVNESPFSAFANSPLVYTDPDGQDNVLYILTLKLDKKQTAIINKAIENANSYLRLMGVTTLVVRAQSNFDLSKLDATDGMVLIGNTKSEVTKYTKENKYFKGIVEDNFLNGCEKDGCHSVSSWNKSTTSTAEYPEITSKNLGVVALDKITEFTKNMQVKIDGKVTFGLKNESEALGLIIVHSMGHQAGSSHNNDPLSKGFMTDGNGLKAHLNGTSVGTGGTPNYNLPVDSIQELFKTTSMKDENGKILDAVKQRTSQNEKDNLKTRFSPNGQTPNPRANSNQ